MTKTWKIQLIDESRLFRPVEVETGSAETMSDALMKAVRKTCSENKRSLSLNTKFKVVSVQPTKEKQ